VCNTLNAYLAHALFLLSSLRLYWKVWDCGGNGSRVKCQHNLYWTWFMKLTWKGTVANLNAIKTQYKMYITYTAFHLCLTLTKTLIVLCTSPVYINLNRAIQSINTYINYKDFIIHRFIYIVWQPSGTQTSGRTLYQWATAATMHLL